MKHLIQSSILALSLMCVAPAAMANPPSSKPSADVWTLSADGTYGGTFLCALGEMGMTLSLKLGGAVAYNDYPGMHCKTGSGPCNDALNARLKKMRKVDGVITFFPTVGNPQAPKGAFRTSGVVEYRSKVSTRLLLDPGDWIRKPDNFGHSGLEAMIIEDRIIGKPTAPRCHAMDLHKTSDR